MKNCYNCRFCNKETKISGNNNTYQYECNKNVYMKFINNDEELKSSNCEGHEYSIAYMNENKYMKPIFQAELIKRYKKWNKTYQEGSEDVNNTDGFILNIYRAQIFNTKHNIEENMLVEDYPDAYFRENPPLLKNEYMANEPRIRNNIYKLLNKLSKNEDYQFLFSYKEEIKNKESKWKSDEIYADFPDIDIVKITNPYELRLAGNNIKNFISSLSERRCKVEKMIRVNQFISHKKEEKEGQLNLF